MKLPMKAGNNVRIHTEIIIEIQKCDCAHVFGFLMLCYDCQDSQ